MVEISFLNQPYLFLLTLIPLAILIHFYTLRKRRAHALNFANFDAISKVKGVDLLSKNILSLIMVILISLSLVFALADLNIHRTVLASSFSFGIAIDNSRSMEATDIFPNRLEAAKDAAMSFVDVVSDGTKMHVLSFSGNAFLEQSPTAEKLLIRQAIREIPISGVGGTDLGEAVITSTNLLRGEKAKTIILLSDGRINVGTVDDAIDYANENGVIIHSIGIGTEEGGLTGFGSLSTIDEDALKAIAHNTGGQYFRAESANALRESFQSILGLKLGKVSIDISSYLIVAALVFLMIQYILTNTRFKAIP
jgi:Ca-activated chloride channel homolog